MRGRELDSEGDVPAADLHVLDETQSDDIPMKVGILHDAQCFKDDSFECHSNGLC